MKRTHLIAGSMFAGALLLAGLSGLTGTASATAEAPRVLAAYPPTSGPTTTLPATTTIPATTTPATTTPASTTPDTTTPDTTTPATTVPASTTTTPAILVDDGNDGNDGGGVVPGEPVAVTVWGCTPGESVVIELRSATGELINAGTATCEAGTGPDGQPSGRATLTFSAPAAGSYTVTAIGNKGFRASAALVVAGTPSTSVGPLPGTGSNSTTAFTTAAVVLLLTGGGILTVSRVRRRPA